MKDMIIRAIMRGIVNAWQKTNEEIENGTIVKDYMDKKGLSDNRDVVSIFNIDRKE